MNGQVTSDHMHLPPPPPPPSLPKNIIVVKDLISLSATNYNRYGGFVLFCFCFCFFVFFFHMKINTQGFRTSNPINCSNRVDTARALALVPRIIEAQYSLSASKTFHLARCWNLGCLSLN